MYKITQEHIDKGIPHKSDACPVALCLHEHLNNTIALSSSYLYFQKPFNHFTEVTDLDFLTIAPGLKSWIRNYDNGLHVKEIEIVIEGSRVYLKDEYEEEYDAN